MKENDAEWKENIFRENEYVMRIKKHGKMNVDALLISDEEHWKNHSDDRSPKQLVNTATLPGIVGEAWAMADWHFGYGFPIGGVVATDVDAGGVISPGGVGFDINCGVRLATMDLEIGDIECITTLAREISKNIPAGASGKGGVPLNENELRMILEEGAKGAVEIGWGESRDILNIESNGILESDDRTLSERALKRGIKQLGTLGSGNHFLELQVVDHIADEEAAKAYGIRLGQVTAMIHTGSRGLGHQVCTDSIHNIEGKYKKRGDSYFSSEWDIELPDRQLAAAPIHSKEGSKYLQDMQVAGNFAFANRSTLTQRLRNVLQKQLGQDGELSLLYDVSHNIAKMENHKIHGKNCNCCVHRKGATRALGGDHSELASQFSNIGQPVLVPGDMGTSSWILAGPKNGENRAFSSSCHGAGRALSRTMAKNTIDSEKLMKELEEKGIIVHAKTPNILSEEAPDAYKDVDEVIKLTSGANLARPVARVRPIVVIKG